MIKKHQSKIQLFNSFGLCIEILFEDFFDIIFGIIQHLILFEAIIVNVLIA
jgi:hypothetical protein